MNFPHHQTIIGGTYLLVLVFVMVMVGIVMLEKTHSSIWEYDAKMRFQAEKQCGINSTWYYYPCQHEIKCAPDAWSEETGWQPNEVGLCGVV